MDEELKNIIIRVGSYPLILIVMLTLMRIFKRPIKELLGLKWPGWKTTLFWLAWYIPIIVIGEIIYFSLGLNEGRVWHFSLPVTIIRASGIMIFAPVLEELIFRGLLFNRLEMSKLGPIWAVIITSVVFAGIHVQYGIMDILIIFMDALYWGWVRYKTGSTIPPLIMHSLTNTIAAVELIWINQMVG